MLCQQPFGLSQLLLRNKGKHHSGIQQEVFLTLRLRVSGGGSASDCRSSGHLGQLCITPIFLGPCRAFLVATAEPGQQAQQYKHLSSLCCLLMIIFPLHLCPDSSLL